MDIATLYQRTVDGWVDRVRDAASADWGAPTPCAGWSVRDLVNHVVGEDRWTVPLVHGDTIADVGDAYDGDLLGDDPAGMAVEAAQEAAAAMTSALPAQGKVHLSYGAEDIAEYAYQLAADHLIHGWDLAVATGTAGVLDADAAQAVAAWFADREEMYRGGGAVGPRQTMTGDSRTDLLAAFGRPADWGPNHALVARFSAAFAAGDVDATMALMTDDCVFEATGPAPDGVRHEGPSAVRAVWEDLFRTTTDPRFTEEESLVAGDRAVVRWRYSWTDGDGSPGHIRGVDVLRLRDGKIAEKLSYVKG